MLLIDTHPSHVEIGGHNHRINTDFRVWVEFELDIQNGGGNLPSLLSAIFPDGIPQDTNGAAKGIEWFYCCGSVPESRKSTPTKSKQSYSFEVDGNAVFADFWKHYKIDLSQEGLHWWVFRALLEGLPEKSEFKQRIYYRTCELKGVSKKERERILKIRSRIEIKSKENGKMTLEERNAQWKAHIAKRHNEAAGGGMNG